MFNKIKTVLPGILYLKNKEGGKKLLRFLYPYYRFRVWYPFWFKVLNRKARSLYKEDILLTPDSLENKVVSNLKANGIAFTTLESLFPDQHILEKIQEYYILLKANARRRTKAKNFLVDLWEKRPVLDFNNPFLSLTLDPKILNSVNGYMEMRTKFFLFNLSIATPMPEGSNAVSSQQWHRDPEDRKLCKVFIYLNDVDETAGPFMYIKGSHYSGKWSKLFPQKPPRGFYPPTGSVENIVSKEDVVIATGEAGTVIFCDTSGLHRGGYATLKERIMFTSGFFSPASLWHKRYDYPDDFERKIKDLDPSVKYALKK